MLGVGGGSKIRLQDELFYIRMMLYKHNIDFACFCFLVEIFRKSFYIKLPCGDA